MQELGINFLRNKIQLQLHSFDSPNRKTCLEDVGYIRFDEKILLTKQAPPQLSPAELRAQEAEATLTVQKVIVGAILLYLCKISDSV